MLPSPLTLVLEFARVEQAEDPWGFRFVPQDYLLRTSGGGFERAAFSWDDALLQELEALRQRQGEPALLQRLGERLRKFLTPLGWPELSAQIQSATELGRRVLLTVRSAAAELFVLPWELLTLKASGQHVGELGSVLLRYEWPETATKPEKPLPRRGGGRILVAWSAAGGAVPAAQHVQAVREACRDGFHPFDSEHDVLEHTSLGKLGQALSLAKQEGVPISVLHILCHGGRAGEQYGLLLDGDTGSSEPSPVDAGRLRQLIAQHADMVRLVVLSACDSGNPGNLGNQLGSVAQTLHRAGIAAVVASRYPLSASGSVRLAESLYRSLICRLDSLADALLSVRTELAQDAASLDWASIQLYARADPSAELRPLVFRPYPGLSAFGAEKRRFYFGREALTDKLWGRCQALVSDGSAARLLTLLGPSGSGKSSLARAGLLSEFARRPLRFSASQAANLQTRCVVMRPGEHPMRSLAAALFAMPDTAPDAPLVILVDQFEEIYTLSVDETERKAFVEMLLLGARASGLPVLLVLTLRSDFIGETERHHPELNRLFEDHAQIITAMDPDELRTSITRPAECLGRPIENATINLLLAEANGRDGALPLLQFALSQIWEGMLAGKLPAEILHSLGGVGGALAGTAQELYDALNESEKAIARRALVRLVRLGEGTRDTRRRVPVTELCSLVDTESAVLSVLRKFSSENARLVTLSGRGKECVAEVTHEALFDNWQTLRGFIEQSRKDRGLHDRALDAAKLWDADDRPAGRLWRSPDLEILADYKRRKPDELHPLQEALLAASLRQQRTEKRLLLGAVLAVVVAFLSAAAVYIGKERQRTGEIRTRLLDSYVDRGQELLFEAGKPGEALLWLHRGLVEGSQNPNLPHLLKSTLEGVEATKFLLTGHKHVVHDASFSPDGRRILTTAPDKTLIFDAKDGSRVIQLEDPENLIRSAKWSSDGKYVVTAGDDKTARIFTAEGGKPVVQLKGHADIVLSAVFSPDGKRVVTASWDHSARVFAADSGSLVAELKGHTERVIRASFSPDGRRVVTASDDKTARIFEAESGKLLAVLAGHRDILRGASFSPDGSRVVTASLDQTARVYDAESSAFIVELKHAGGAVRSATFSPDSLSIVTAGDDKSARIWNAKSGMQLATLEGHRDSIFGATWSSDSQRIVTASDDATARVFEARSGHLLAELRGHTDRVNSAAFSPDGERIITTSDDSTARMWQLPRGRFRGALLGIAGPISGVVVSRDGRRIIVATRYQSSLVYDGKHGELVSPLEGHADTLDTSALSPDQERIVMAGGNGTARIFALESGALIAELKGHEAEVSSAAYSTDGKYIVTGSFDRTARVYESGGKLLATLRNRGGPIYSARFSPDGKRIITISEDNWIGIWDWQSNPKSVFELPVPRGGVKEAVVSPNGQRIAARIRSGQVILIDAKLRRSLTRLEGHLGTVNSVSFSPDSRLVVTASFDNTARVWESEGGRLLAVLKGHIGSINSAAFSPDSRLIATASADGTARLWEAASGRLLAVLQGHSNPVTRVTFSPDGLRIVTAGEGRVAIIWDASPETRPAAELARLLRCLVLARFERDGSNIIASAIPDAAECQSGDHTKP